MMNKFISLSLLVLFICCVSCETNSAQTASSLDVKAYRAQLTGEKSFQLVDVRTAEEFESGHLERAININYNGNDFEQQINALDKNKPTYIYCLSGGRSSAAMDVMTKKGFKQVINMKGGILEWKANQFPLENNKNNTTGWIGMTKAAYDQLTQSKTPILFDFKAKWCGPCKQLSPILDDLAAEYKDKIKIIQIDVDENKSLADELKIRSIPFLIYYKNGKHTMNIEGLTDKKNLIKSLGLKK
jgi:thioredoxin 1